MTDVLDAPVPFLIGIDPSILEQEITDDDGTGDRYNLEIPNEVYRVDLDRGFISLRDQKPKVQSNAFKILKTRL
jgi:hypothetical protein